MGCLLAEFELTAMLFGGGRWGEVGGVVVWLRLLFGVCPLCTLHPSSLTFTSHWRVGRRKTRSVSQGRHCAVRRSADLFVRKYAAL